MKKQLNICIFNNDTKLSKDSLNNKRKKSKKAKWKISLEKPIYTPKLLTTDYLKSILLIFSLQSEVQHYHKSSYCGHCGSHHSRATENKKKNINLQI